MSLMNVSLNVLWFNINQPDRICECQMNVETKKLTITCCTAVYGKSFSYGRYSRFPFKSHLKRTCLILVVT